MIKKSDFGWLKNQARDSKSRKIIQEIEKDHELVFDQNKIIRDSRLINANLGKYKIWFRKGGACSSIEIYYEIFKEKDHMNAPGFSGKDEKVVVDVGANEGFYTMKIKQNNPLCKIIAIEANPLAFKIMHKNVISNNLKGVILVNKALGRNNGKISMDFVDEITSIGSKNLKDQKRPWLKDQRIKKRTVDLITLPALCEKHSLKEIGILKIDVEGMEMEILRSSKNVLKNVKKIVVEWHTEKLRDEIKKFLKSQGFNLIREEKRNFGNLYFINKNLK